ncbi:zinc finger (C3HC4-type RING finger) family protein [Abeliophyllum distichum]|uniref:RBR-type E3 ubiquitin transferase n=1 Tax=Abeliophyllum distichum TaxID=126358 RepID=A0ABD1Q4J0_9LAMI
MELDEDVSALLAAQRLEVAAAQNLESDLSYAFQLQLQEAITASLSVDAASSSSPITIPDELVSEPTLPDIFEDELSVFERELHDHYEADELMKRFKVDLDRQIHDRAFACEVSNISEAEWRETGDNIERPYGEGSSSSNGQNFNFTVYAKGLVKNMVGGIGVAICDGNDGLVFEVSKGFTGNEVEVNTEVVEVKALIEGLEVATMLGLKRLTIVCDSALLYEYITGKTQQMQANVASLASQMKLLLRKFTYCNASLVAKKDIKFAFELARNAVASQVNQSAGNSIGKKKIETCAICLEDVYLDQMFLIRDCLHSYCFSCVSKHVQVKLLQGMLPKCPYEKCKSELKLESCKTFLSPELFDIMSQRVKEASIPAAEKIYCPYPMCSSLFSDAELKGSRANTIRKCPKCLGSFCINCRVPWHRISGVSVRNVIIWFHLLRVATTSIADVDTSFVTHAELNGETKKPPAIVVSGMNATLCMIVKMDIGKDEDDFGVMWTVARVFG